MKVSVHFFAAIFVLMTVSVAARAQDVPAKTLKAGIAAYESKDYARSLALLRPLAEAGDPDAQFFLGKIYYWGRDVARDRNLAVRWFTRAAKQGHGAGVNFLGTMIANGEGTAKDKKKAECLYRLAAEQGNDSAQFNIAVIEGERFNFNASGRWIDRAVAQGNIAAMVRLARAMILNPLQRDKQVAYKYVAYAAAQGNSWAKKELARAIASTDGMFLAAVAEGRRRAAAWHPVGELPSEPALLPPSDCLP